MGMPVIEPRGWPGPVFTREEVFEMKRALREHFRSSELDDVTFLDLWQLYDSLRNEEN